MPNWCITTIKFYSKNKNAVDNMYREFRKIIEGKPTAENDFGAGWLGDFANKYFPQYGHEKVDCKGKIEDIVEPEYVEDYKVFTLWTRTAWGAKMKIWDEIVKMFFPEIQIAYIAEEGGSCYYVKYDNTPGCVFFPEVFYLDGYLPRKDGDADFIEEKYSFDSIESIMSYLESILPFEFEHKNDLGALEREIQEKLNDKYNDEDSQEFYIEIEEFDEVSPSEFKLLM